MALGMGQTSSQVSLVFVVVVYIVVTDVATAADNVVGFVVVVDVVNTVVAVAVMEWE